MVALTLPDGGSVYLDASALIYSVERVEPYRTLLSPMWDAVAAETLTVASSRIIVVETLVKPLRDGSREIEAQYRELFADSVFRVLEMSPAVFDQAAQLRADFGLKIADALHAATALRAGCELFITNDADFRRVGGLPVVVLRDLLDDDSEG